MTDIIQEIQRRTGLTMTAKRGPDGVLFDCERGCLFLPWSMPITADEVVKRIGRKNLANS
jgi:hypothetical protein